MRRSMYTIPCGVHRARRRIRFCRKSDTLRGLRLLTSIVKLDDYLVRELSRGGAREHSYET